MSTELQQMSPMQALATTLTKMRDQFSSSLPANVTPERFIRTAINGIQTHKDVDKLLGADRKSLFLACQKCAQDGLVLDGREAALVTFFNKDRKVNEVVYMPMVQGLVKLARNSDQIDSIFAEVVYKNDSFNYRIGIDKQCQHNPDWFSDNRGPAIGAFCTIALKNGEFVNAIMPKKKIMAIASKSKNSFQYDSEKGIYFDEWWKKAAIKNALKYAPKSQEVDHAIQVDNDQEFNFSVIDAEGAEEVTVESSEPKTQTKAESAILGKGSKKKTAGKKTVKKEKPPIEGEATVETEATSEQPPIDSYENVPLEGDDLKSDPI